MTTSALRALIKKYPDNDIYLLTSKACKSILDSFNGRLSLLFLKRERISCFNLILSYFDLILRFGFRRFEKAYLFFPNIWMVLMTVLLAKEVHCFKKRGKISSWIYDVLRIKYKEWTPRGKYIAKVYHSLVDPDESNADGFLPVINADLYNQYQSRELSDIAKVPYIAFFPGGGVNIREKNLYKRLGPKKTIDTLEKLSMAGFSNIIIGGDANDDMFSSDEKEKLRIKYGSKFITGKTNMHDLIFFIKNSSAVISTDSLPMHIAVALKKRLIAVFGPSDENSMLPGEKINTFAVREKLLCKCSPCYSNSTFKGCRNGGICMKNFDCALIIENLKNFNDLITII